MPESFIAVAFPKVPIGLYDIVGAIPSTFTVVDIALFILFS